MKSLNLLPIAALALAFPLTAQVNATLSTGNAGGISLTSGTSTVQKQNWTNPKTFSTYEYLYKYVQTSTSTWYRDYVRTYVSPPRKWYGYTYNYVSIYNYAYFRKGTSTKKGGTTKDATGASGAQIYNIDLTGSGKVILDTRIYGSIYGNSKITMKLTGPNSYSKTWTYSANGYSYKYEKISLTVTNKARYVFTIDAQVDRSGKTPGKYYDGYYSGIFMNVLQNNPGSFAVDNKNDKCGGGTSNPYPLVGNGTPQKGTYYDVSITKMKSGQACSFLYGTNNKTLRGFLTLPMPLDYMGAKNCSLGVDFYYPWARKADSTGKATMKLYLSSWYSRTYYIQGVVFDSSAPGGLVMTNLGTLK